MSNTNSRTGSAYILSTTLQKSFAIIEFIAENQPVVAAQIRRGTGLSRGNVYRLLATLKDLGYASSERDGYTLTFKMFALGNTVPGSRGVVRLARPYLERIADDFRVSAFLSVRDNLHMVNLDRVRPKADVTVSDDFAVSYGLHCTASGKLVLAWMDRGERDAVYAAMTFAPLTDRTARSRDVLERQVQQVSADGYSIERREHGPNINSVAAPILDHAGHFVASLSAAGPVTILDEEMIDRMIPRLVADARDISTLMGHQN